MQRIGIYGGTFNPPHRGHMEAAMQAVQMLKLDKLLMIPAAIPPHKALPEGSPSAEQRLELVQLAAAGKPNISVSDLELRRAGQSYTVDTVLQLHRAYPQDQLYLIMGTDMLASFHRWYQPEIICRYATLAVLTRETEDAAHRMHQQADLIRSTLGGQVNLLQNAVLPMSSTDVRRMLKFQCGEAMLPQQVYQRIRELGLYGVNERLFALPADALEAQVRLLVDQRRIAHVLGCRDTAVQLAKQYGASTECAERAGLLHDVTKALPLQCQISLCHFYGIDPQRLAMETEQTVHALTGAVVAGKVFRESEAVCSAIETHTTGCAFMNTLQKIVYLADYIEPNRNFPGVERLRLLAREDLDAAVLLGMQMTLEHLQQQGKSPAQRTQEAINWLAKQRT